MVKERLLSPELKEETRQWEGATNTVNLGVLGMCVKVHVFNQQI